MALTVLVWLLITGSEGGHVPPGQLGPFATEADCMAVANLAILRRYERSCVQARIILKG